MLRAYQSDSGQQAHKSSRLGRLLINKGLITQLQLDEALKIQEEQHQKLGESLVSLGYIDKIQLKSTLTNQSITRCLAAAVALTCAPFNASFASEKSSNIGFLVASAKTSEISLDHPFSQDIDASWSEIQNAYGQPKEGDNAFRLTYSKPLSSRSGIKLSFRQPSDYDFDRPVTDQFLDLSPQISFYKSFSDRSSSNASFTKQFSGNKLNKYTNTVPVVYMITLKGYCLLENRLNKTTMWSLDRPKLGVERKAELMFSFTKQF